MSDTASVGEAISEEVVTEVMVAPPSLDPEKLTVKLHRQRVPVKGANGEISYKSVYFGTIFVGSPVPQEFSVVYDTGSGHVIVPSEQCRSPTCRTHRRYNRKASADAQDVDYDGTPVLPGGDRDQITIAFGTGEVTGEFVQDTLCLGTSSRKAAQGKRDDDCVSLRVVSATEMTDDPFQAFAFDGVLGLSLASLALAPEFSFFGQMVQQGRVAQPAFGVFLGDHDDEPSEICFGGHNDERVEKDITWTPVVQPDMGYWQVQILDIRVGNRSLDFCSDGECRAVVDTGTSLLAVPKIFVSDLQQELTLGSSSLPQGGSPPQPPTSCADAMMPSLEFILDGMTVTLEPVDYSRMTNNACRPALMPIELPEPLGPKLFIWGEPVLRKYYTVYHWEKQQIGFGIAKHIPQKGSDGANPTSSAPAPLVV